MINSQNKGKRAEREVAKIINQMLGTNAKRTPQSGGLDFKGDILDTSTDSIIHLYHFEIKDHKSIQIGKWWEQATGDCNVRKTPLLIFNLHHKNKSEWLACLSLYDLLGLLKEGVK